MHKLLDWATFEGASADNNDNSNIKSLFIENNIIVKKKYNFI